MIYYRKTLFGSGPKLTAVHSCFSVKQQNPILIGIKQSLKFIYRFAVDLA